MKIKYPFILIGFFIFILYSASSAFALTVFSEAQFKTIVPLGSSQAPIFRFDVSGNTTEAIYSIQLSKTVASSTTDFGVDITEVIVYLDANGDKAFTAGTDTQVGTSGTIGTATDPLTITLSNPVNLTTTLQTIMIIYKVSQSSTIGNTLGVRLTLINNAAPPGASGATRTITISGISSASTDISPTYFMPGQTDVSMLAFSLQASQESTQDDLSITIRNESSTFASTTSANGVTRVRLFEDTDGSGAYESANDTELESITPTSSSSTVTFTFPNPFILNNGVTRNLLLLYDFGASTNVEITAKAQVYSVSGTGAVSSLTMQVYTAFPATAVSVSGAGTLVKNVASIAPSGNYGPGASQMPIFRYSLRGYNISPTINSMTVKNAGSIPFVTTSGGSNGVTKVYIYEDANSNLSFDGSDQETLVVSMNMGATGQTSTEATLTFTGSLVPTYDSNLNNERTFFVLYDLGTGFNATTSPSSTIQGQLVNVTGSITTTTNIGIGGSLPATPNVSVTLTSTNLAYSNLSSVVPASAPQGAYNLQMVKFDLTSNSNLTGLSFVISNSQGTFSALGTGVSKIILFKDDNSSGTLDSSDVVIGSTSSFTSSSEATISGVSLSQGTTTVFLAYNISPAATLGSNNVAAQIKSISNGTVYLAGVAPFPITPARCSITAASLTLSQVNSGTTSVSPSSTGIQVTLTIANNGATAVTINSIAPHFYQTTISGSDVTTEYTLTTTPSITTLPVGNTNLNFVLSAAQVRTGGTIILDGVIDYLVGTTNVRISRYQSTTQGNYTSGATATDSWYANVTYTAQPGDLPSHVASMNAGPAGFMNNFQPDDAIPANSQLEVSFTNGGENVDLHSIVVQLNGVTLTEGTDYTIDHSTGKLTINSVGASSGTVKIMANDTSGKSLEDINLSFVISSSYNIYNFFCHPNPINPVVGATNTLRIAYQATQVPSSVTVRIFDSSADLVTTITDPTPTIGYNEITWNPVVGGRYLAAGIYILFLEMVAPDGSRQVKKTKLVVSW